MIHGLGAAKNTHISSYPDFFILEFTQRHPNVLVARPTATKPVLKATEL
jgi:hypothetical protein